MEGGDGLTGSTQPLAAGSASPRRTRALRVWLLQWLWQQPTWQAAACTHCSLLFVHCQGKGAGGRAEGEEGTGNYKESTEKKRKKKAITPEAAAGVWRNVHLLPADTGPVYPPSTFTRQPPKLRVHRQLSQLCRPQRRWPCPGLPRPCPQPGGGDRFLGG